MSRTGHLSGLAAEEIALRLYEAEGARLLARRWRSAGGEIDLVVELAGAVVFVEVKARRGRDAAAAALGVAQRRRIGASALAWLAAAGDRPCRFDLVLVDGAGVPERIKNALHFDGW